MNPAQTAAALLDEFRTRAVPADLGDSLGRELIIDRTTGAIRQAGAEGAGPWLGQVRRAAERSLYTFTKGILGRDYLTASLHKPACDWLQRNPPRRKCLLLPREHGKTSIVSHGLPLHILIQPPEDNLYWPGVPGSDMRIVLACETEQRATDHLRVLQTTLEANPLVRALWPHVCWDNPRAQSKKWNDREMIIRRAHEFPDPSIRAIGVGGAITGAHPTILIKDDLIALEAANSPTVMQTAIQWHVASRALINDDRCLEFIIGTRWAVHDIYSHIQKTDPSVDIQVRAVLEDDVPIYPEKFSLDKIAQLRAEFGVMYPLLYLNRATDAALTDFVLDDVRLYTQAKGSRELAFADDARDEALRAAYGPAQPDLAPLGLALSPDTYDLAFPPGGGWRARGG